MGNESLPKNLYPYRFHTTGGPFVFFTEVGNGDDMWAMVKKAKTPKGEDLRLWVRLRNGTFERYYIDASTVIGMSDRQSEKPAQKPNPVQERRNRPNATASSAIARKSHPSRVTIGQTANKPSGRKKV